MWFLAAAYAVKAYGEWQQKGEMADAANQNAAYYTQQAEYSKRATDRELMIFNDKSTGAISNTIGAYAASGVNVGSGAALEVITGEQIKADKERDAIRREGSMRTQLSYLRARQSANEAASLTGSASAFSTFGGAMLGFGGDAVRADSSSKNEQRKKA